MRYTAAEKEEIIRVIKSSEISIGESLRYLGIPRSFYNETIARHFKGVLDFNHFAYRWHSVSS